MKKNLIVKEKNFWDDRVNLKNKPSLSRRTVEVISYLMENGELALGKVMEKLMITPRLYAEMEKKLREEGFNIPVKGLEI